MSNQGLMREIAVPPGGVGERIDRLIATLCPDLSRSRAKSLIEDGRLRDVASSAPVRDPAMRAKAGQVFHLSLPPPMPAAPAAQEMDLPIVYEDADLIVIDKPAGLVVHPAPGNPDRTLVNALLAHCAGGLSGIGGVARPGIVHRIDKETSGLIVAAKNDAAHRALSARFASHDIERTYLCLVWGVPAPLAGSIAGAIGRDPKNRKRMAMVKGGGKPALTHYRTERSFGLGAALVECRLATGRTHQIRVHMAALGHPLLGDPLYGKASAARQARLSPAARQAALAFPRQALHASSLGFPHPRTGEFLLWQSELPADMAKLSHILGESKPTEPNRI